MLALTLTACKKANTEQDTGTEKDPQAIEGKDNEAAVYEQFPLTGVNTDVKPEGRAIAAMINNHPDARQQNGLSEADIVYEVLAEGGITRFLAIFQSELPERIGPIRSARDYYIELAQGYDSLFIAHGYSPDAEKMLASGEIDHLNGIRYDGILFKRASFRKAPHNSYISFDSIKEGAAKLGYNMIQAPDRLKFLADGKSNKDGEQAQHLKISYDRNPNFVAEYKYDEQSERYIRFSGGMQTVEYETEDPVHIDNVFVLEATHHVIDESGRREIDLTSGGRAFLLQKGMSYEVEWKNHNGRLLPYIGEEQVELVPGKTWINIVPNMNIVSFD